MVYCKKRAAIREYEDLKEGIWFEPALAVLRKNTNEELTEKHRNVARKEAGCRSDSSTSVGQMKVSAKHFTMKTAPKSTSSTIAQNGTKSEGDFTCFQKVGKNEHFKGGMGVAKRYCYASFQWQQLEQGPLQHEKCGSPTSTKAWVYHRKVSRATLQQTALFWLLLESGRHLVGSVVQLDYDQELGPFAWDVRLDEGRI